MTIEEMKQHEWIVSWSGGKDSTATIILMHEHHIPIKEIIYVRMMYDEELPATLPVMTEFVDHAKEVFESWGYKVRVVNSHKTAVDLMNCVYKRSKYPIKNGHKYGINAFNRAGCWFSKIKVETIRKCKSDDEYEMIGYASDETKRIHRLGGKKQSIMLELGVREREATDICNKYNLLSPFYNSGFKRDGCWFCPNMNQKARDLMRELHPELVEKIIDGVKMMEYDATQTKYLNYWYDDYSYLNKNFTEGAE